MYYEEYRVASDEEKICLLQGMYKDATIEEKQLIVAETQLVYNRIKGRTQ